MLHRLQIVFLYDEDLSQASRFQTSVADQGIHPPSGKAETLRGL